MLLLFKKIRATLMKEGSFRKYIPYALGEILLVTIGILIALQVNNLNEQRKDRKLERAYYRSLIVDLTKDSLDFVFRDMVAQGNINRMSNIIRFIEEDYDPAFHEFIPVEWGISGAKAILKTGAGSILRSTIFCRRNFVVPIPRKIGSMCMRPLL